MKKTNSKTVTVNPDSTTQQTVLSMADKATEGYFATLDLENLKKQYGVIKKELSRLDKMDKLLESTSLKRRNIPYLKEKQKKLLQEYDSIYSVAKEWLKSTLFDDKVKLKVTLAYYSNIEIEKDLFQDTINSILKKKGKIPYQYQANNIRQKLERAWRRQIEGR